MPNKKCMFQNMWEAFFNVQLLWYIKSREKAIQYLFFRYLGYCLSTVVAIIVIHSAERKKKHWKTVDKVNISTSQQTKWTSSITLSFIAKKYFVSSCTSHVPKPRQQFYQINYHFVWNSWILTDKNH